MLDLGDIPVLSRLKENGIYCGIGAKVKLHFAPATFLLGYQIADVITQGFKIQSIL